MALMGRMPDSPGRMQMRLHSSVVTAPQSSVTGSRVLWFEVPSSRRAMCGTASPMNEMGPQKAVVDAVSSPVTMSSRLRVSLMFTPRLAA